MANWYHTSFKTIDKDIVNIIRDGQTIEFDYNEQTGYGTCDLRYGLCAINLEKIENLAAQHKSDFHIKAFDIMADTEQELEFKNGEVVISEVRHNIVDWNAIMDDSNNIDA